MKSPFIKFLLFILLLVVIFVGAVLVIGCDKTPTSPEIQSKVVKSHDQGGIK